MLKLYLAHVKGLTRKHKGITRMKIQEDLRSLFEHSQLSVNRILLRTPPPGIYIRSKSCVTNFKELSPSFDKVRAE